MSHVMLNGELLDEREATVSALDRGLTHGVGLYETIKIADGPAPSSTNTRRASRRVSPPCTSRCPFTRDDLAQQILAVAAGNGVARRSLPRCWSRPGRPGASRRCWCRPTCAPSRSGR